MKLSKKDPQNFTSRITKIFSSTSISELDYQDPTIEEPSEGDYKDFNEKNFSVMNPEDVIDKSPKLKYLLNTSYIKKLLSDTPRLRDGIFPAGNFVFAFNYGDPRKANDGSITKEVSNRINEFYDQILRDLDKNSKIYGKLESAKSNVTSFFSKITDFEFVGNNRGLLIIPADFGFMRNESYVIFDTSIVNPIPVVNKFVFSYHQMNNSKFDKGIHQYCIFDNYGVRPCKTYLEARTFKR